MFKGMNRELSETGRPRGAAPTAADVCRKLSRVVGAGPRACPCYGPRACPSGPRACPVPVNNVLIDGGRNV